MSDEPKVKHFSDLHAWQEAHKLILFVYKLTKKFPKDEKFGLTNQSRRAAISISSNIAEGFGRGTSKNKNHFYTISKTSLAELQSQMMVAEDLEYANKKEFDDIEKQSIVTDKLLSGLMRTAMDK